MRQRFELLLHDFGDVRVVIAVAGRPPRGDAVHELPAIGKFDAFWSDDPLKALMHGPTFMGNALACAAANASLDLFEREPRLQQAAAISVALRRELGACRGLPGVKDVRVQGAIGVVELAQIDNLHALRQAFIAESVFVRPFGSTIYLTPAFTIGEEDLAKLTGAVVKVVKSLA